MKTRAIVREIEILAPPARVWRALTRPAELGRWWPVVAELEARPGGRYKFEWGCSMVSVGTVVAARAPRRLALDYTIPELESGQKPTRVAFELAPVKSGTRVRLAHTGFSAARADDEYFLSHVEGWTVDLVELANLCERGAPGTVLTARGRLVGAADVALARVVERLRRDGHAGSRARVEIELESGSPELVVTESFDELRVDEAAAFARWRRLLRGTVRGLVCGTVYS